MVHNRIQIETTRAKKVNRNKKVVLHIFPPLPHVFIHNSLSVCPSSFVGGMGGSLQEVAKSRVRSLPKEKRDVGNSLHAVNFFVHLISVVILVGCAKDFIFI
jgi:hypothetical protein